MTWRPFHFIRSAGPAAARLILVACLALALAGLAGCGGAPSTETKEAAGIEKVTERGPVKIVLRVDKKEPTIADHVKLEMEITSDEDYEVELPKFGEKLDQFGIVDYSSSQPELVEGNRTRRTRTYDLEPFLSGEYTIPPMEFQFWQKGEAEPKRHTLETEAITLQVKSLLPENVANLQIHEIDEPVELPRPEMAFPWKVLAGVLALAGILGFVWYRWRKGPEAVVVPPLPAHEQAFLELQALVARNLVEEGLIKEFYQGISDVLRRYIERRFGLHAPEQTTEEFLDAMRRRPELFQSHRDVLKNFLKHCDMVKFAELHPSGEEIQATFNTCKEFINLTRADAEPATAA